MTNRNKVNKAIRKYLLRRWKYLGEKMWQPSCGRAVYIRRNTPCVQRNVEDSPDYIKNATKALDEL